jgi:3-methylfumaryl-CoA hydratase
MDFDFDRLRSWIGREETVTDSVRPFQVAGMAATLDRDDPSPAHGDALPPPWHWMFFQPTALQSELGPDGHPKRGEFLPPVPLPRRMWAGGRLAFLAPLHVGDAISRVSRIADVTMKEGRSGRLVFVLVRHQLSGPRGLAITEEHDIVYRDEAAPGEAPAQSHPAPMQATWQREIMPDPVLLFRYSALTFNGHRIHYDRPYATEIEGYPGLIVHGPLIATLLLDLVRRNSPAIITGFRFRALRPLFDTAPFTLCGNPNPDDTVSLWTRDCTGQTSMQATAMLA